MALDLMITRSDSSNLLATVNINGLIAYPYDLDTVTEIIFNIKANTNPLEVPLIQKKLSLVEIVIGTPTTLGQFTVILTPADTKLLNQLRSYWLDAQIQDAVGTFTVVAATIGAFPSINQG